MKKIYLPLLAAFLLSCTPANSSSTSEKTSESTTESSSSTSEVTPSSTSSTTTEEESSSSEVSDSSSKEESESTESSSEGSSEESSYEEPSESSIGSSEETSSESSEEEPIEISSEEPPIESSEGSIEEYHHEFILDANNGKITGPYSSTEAVNDTGKDDNGDSFKVGYKMCMTSSNNEYAYAQMKKNEGVLYSISSLGELKAITVTLSSSGNMKLEVMKGQNDSYTLSSALKSNETLGVPSGYTHFRISAGSSAAYIKSISLIYSSSDIEILPPSEDTSSSSFGSIETGSGDITLPPVDVTDTTAYYEDIGENASGKELKTELCHLIDDHTNKGYDYAYTAYKTTDVDADNKIIDMYSAYRFDPETDHQGAPGKSNYNAEGQMFNREHTIPQSVFNEGAPMKSDLHHLLPTDAYVNNKRGNLPHAEVDNVTYTSTNGTKIGTSTVEGYSGGACEVPDQYKGDFARIYFYMVTRYEEKLPNWKAYACFDKKSFPGLSSWAIDLYLRWSDEDPVSDKEIIRNEEIAKIQLNRNPFIDHPEYAHRIWDNA